jgi:hypothetical protein
MPLGLISMAPNAWYSAEIFDGLRTGDTIATWWDQSGKGYHASQASSAAQPMWSAVEVGGRPAVRFDGIDDMLDLVPTNPTYLMLTPASITVVVVGTAFSAARDVFFGGFGGDSCGAGRGLRVHRSLFGLGQGDGSEGQVVPASQPAALGQFAIYTASYANGGQASMRVNGLTASLAVMTPDTAGISYTNWVKFSLGAWQSGTAAFGCSAAVTNLHGAIAELLVFAPALTAATLAVVESQLGAKYGISLGP